MMAESHFFILIFCIEKAEVDNYILLVHNPKKQHYISRCYLKQFADPTQSGKEPRIWVISKDGTEKELKKVEKAFVKKHIYSLKSNKPNSPYDYSIEISLSELEDRYSTIFENKISKKTPLTDEEHIYLCLFIAAMMLRTEGKKENIEQNLDQVIGLTEQMEKAHNLPSDKSNELRNYKKDAHKLSLANLLPDITEILVQMNLSFLCAKENGKARFITSDDPCNLFNPDLQWQRPYGYGLAQKNIQLTIPLSTKISACFCWGDLRGYIYIPDRRIHDHNRMVRGMCHSHFISSSNATRRIWFSRYPFNINFIVCRALPNKFANFICNLRCKNYAGRKRKI